MPAIETVAKIDQTKMRQEMGKFERIEIRPGRYRPSVSNFVPIVEKHTLFRQRQLCPEGAIGQHLFPSQNRISPRADYGRVAPSHAREPHDLLKHHKELCQFGTETPDLATRSEKAVAPPDG
jgi:hypothetical protein